MPPLLPTAGQALLRSIGNQARGLYTPSTNPFLDPAGFLASDDPEPIFQRPAKQLGRGICRAWARQSGESTNPAADRLYGAVCAPYLAGIGEQPDPGEVGPPFQGGQCDGSTYSLSGQYTSSGVFCSDGSPITQNFFIDTGFFPQLIGPVGSITAETFGQDCRGLPRGTRIRIIDDGGARTQTVEVSGESGPAGWSSVTFSPVVTLTSGNNNCGNPAPEYKPPRAPIVLPPITPIFISLPDIGDINVEVNLFPDGTFQLCSDEVDTCVEIGSPDSDAPTGSGGGIDGVDLAPSGGLPSTPIDTGDGEGVQGQAPEGQELVGVLVQVLTAPIGANEYANQPAQVFRGCCYVRMGYPGRLALDLGGAAVLSPQFFLAPVRGLTNWEVRANVGFINRITPYYRLLPL